MTSEPQAEENREARERLGEVLMGQGLSHADAEVVAGAILGLDWAEILVTRRELSELTGVPVATISYHATRIDSARWLRPFLRKRGGEGRPSQSLFLAPASVPAYRELTES